MGVALIQVGSSFRLWRLHWRAVEIRVRAGRFPITLCCRSAMAQSSRCVFYHCCCFSRRAATTGYMLPRLRRQHLKQKRNRFFKWTSLLISEYIKNKLSDNQRQTHIHAFKAESYGKIKCIQISVGGQNAVFGDCSTDTIQ